MAAEGTPPGGRGVLGSSQRLVRFTFTLALSLGAVYTAGWGVIDEVLVRAGFVGLALLVVILIVPLAPAGRAMPMARRRIYQAIDAILFVFAVAAIYRYISVTSELEIGIYEFTSLDRFFAVLGFIVLLELTRRLYGLPLLIVCLFALIYALFGDKLPWIFEHAGFSWRATVRTVWYSFDGVFGQLVAVVTSLILIFIVFGAILEGTGAGRILLKIAFALTGRLRGGPAHAAVVASALFGTISGSVSANVVGTGVFTMPMIKERGFPSKFAGAVEAAASSGGQFMPPVMGAVAFIMSDVTNIPYLTIAAAALVPALFYYGGLFAAVSIEAVKRGIEPIPPDQREKITLRDWIDSLMFVIPLLVVIFMMIGGSSPAKAGFWATLIAVALGFILNPRFRARPHQIVLSLAKGGEGAARIMVAVAAIGIVVGVLNMTGLGLRFASLISTLAGESLILSLLVMMLGSLVLGMGMPTVPAYLIIILTMGPAISELGVPVLTAHLFVVYFGVLSSITPPVAIAAYAAAPICGAPPMQTATEAVRVALLGFIIPFVFVFNPSLVLVLDFDPLAFIWVALRLTLAIWLLATSLSGYERGPLRLWSRAARGVLVLGVLIDLTGVQVVAFVVAIAILTYDRWLFRRSLDLPASQQQSLAAKIMDTIGGRK